MSRGVVRILLGVGAAVLAVVLLLQERGDPIPADPLAGAREPDAPSSLAPDAAARLASSPGGASAPSPVPTVELPEDRPSVRPAEAGIRGRIDFGGASPSGLVLRLSRVPVGAPPGARPGSFVDISIAPDGTFAAPPSEGDTVQYHLSWDGGSAELRRYQGSRDAREFVLRLGTARLEGRILDAEGRPVAGVYLRDDFRGGRFAEATAVREALTDAGGSWRLEHLPAGLHGIQSVRPVGAAQENDVRWETVDLAAGEHRTLELGVVAGDAIWSGRVRRRGGGPLPGPGHLFLTNGHSQRRSPHDVEGRFRIAVTPGPYKVVVEPRSPRRGFVLDLPTDLRPITTPPAPHDSILLRTPLEADVVLVGGAVSGRVPTDERVEYVLGVVAFRPVPPGSSAPRPEVDPFLERVDEDRRFAAVALPPGRYVVAGLHLGRIIDLVGPDGQPVVVDVVDGGEITGLELRVKAP